MMARDWGKNTNGSHLRGKLGGCCGCSYRRTTLFVCSINIFVALYVLRTLYASIYLYSSRDSAVVRYTPDQILVMEESARIREAAEPLELPRLVKQLEKRLYGEETVELLLPLKRKITDQILERLKVLNATATIGEQREAVEAWRKEKLREVDQLILGNVTSPSNFLPEEAGLLKKAMGSSWAFLSEEIGFWIPMEVVNKEHDVKPDDEEEIEEEVLPGRPLPPECHTELHTDYDGIAVRWGLTHHKESAADCCQACLDQAKYAKPSEKKCNIWVYCPSETGCYSPDVYEHKNQECWLKYAEQPRLNFKDRYSETYRNTHPNAPLVVSWVSGVITQ
ncbi:hypothetical protein MLD38_034449 [Melastoma candidum]|uniref:Uncharacterized protein n=1 Tax=Melastoma candidum TaxID=119954 RepID=A0ACB9MBU9_9MYRT|nr:hypothetical protein MLD38_034449 [Melastoma candidum]